MANFALNNTLVKSKTFSIIHQIVKMNVQSSKSVYNGLDAVIYWMCLVFECQYQNI